MFPLKYICITSIRSSAESEKKNEFTERLLYLLEKKKESQNYKFIFVKYVSLKIIEKKL